jgi:hypothetical protein
MFCCGCYGFVFLFCFLLLVLGVEFRTSCLLDRCSTFWAMLPVLFALAFGDRVSNLCPGHPEPWSSYVHFIAGMTSMCHHTQLLVEMGISPTFIPGWPLTAVLQISASCLAGITDTSHHAWPHCFCIICFSIFFKLQKSWNLQGKRLNYAYK